jgi:hypothetical protein
MTETLGTPRHNLFVGTGVNPSLEPATKVACVIAPASRATPGLPSMANPLAEIDL